MKDNLKKNISVISIFSIILIAGLFVVQDYGVSQDEYANRFHGIVALNYIGEIFFPSLTETITENKSIPSYDDQYLGKFYGSYYYAFVGILEFLFNIDDKYSQFLLRHYVNFIIFFVSLIYFYLTLTVLTKNKLYSILGVLMLLLSPKIFAGSFYNTIDIFFFSIVIILNYYLVRSLENLNLKNIIFVSLFTAFAVDHRIAGIFFLVLNFFFLLIHINLFVPKNKYQKFYPYIYLILSIFFIYIFWPYLWSDPINNFITAFKEMSNWSFIVDNLFMGKIYPSNEVPIFYIPFWMFISTPFFYTLLFLFGLLFLLKELKNFNKYLISKNLKSYFFLAVLIGNFIAIIIFQPSLYNSWRHFYFLYPSMIIISVIGIQFFDKNIIRLIIGALIINFIFLTNWMIKNHPNQEVYFNFMFKKNYNKKYDMDYWGASYKTVLENILYKDKRDKIKLYNLSKTKLFYSLFSLKPQDRMKFIEVNNVNDADYLITNYYLFDKKNIEILNNYSDKDSFFDIKVDGINIYTVYKR